MAYKITLSGSARKCAAQALRVARSNRDLFGNRAEMFGNAIAIAANMVQIEREGGNFASANAYAKASAAIDRAAPYALA